MSTRLTVSILENEFWWGGSVHHGYEMPIGRASELFVDPGAPDSCDQNAPVYVSSKGRYLWSDSAFTLRAEGERCCWKEHPIYAWQRDTKI